MKKRVRIYKAEDGIGKVANPLSNFISKAQAGMQQQTDQQQILMQVVSALAPVEQGGQGADPQSVYQMLAQKYGQEAANQLINTAAQYLQQYTQQESPQTAQSTQQPMSDLAVQEDLMDAERRRQAMMEDERISSEDDMFMDDLLYGEAKYGAELNKAKRKLVKSTVKLAKKQLGDAVKNEQETADSTDILNGRNKKVTGFLNSVKNNVELYNVEKQAEQFADTYFSQFGGAINPELYKYVYGGNDPSIPNLTQAQTGLTVTDKWGNTKQLTQEEIDYWNQQSALDSNLRLTDLSFASEAPDTNTNNNLSDQQQLFLNAGKLAGYPNYYNPTINKVPYFSDNLFGSMIPYNKGRWKNVMGQPTYAGTNLPFTDNLFGKDMAGWSVTKERLGPGAKKYTFRPEFDQQADNASDLEKERKGLFGRRDDDSQGPFSNLREKFSYALKGAYEPQDSGRGSKGKLSNFFSRNKKAQDGLQTYQGNATGSSVNTQLNDMPVLKPKTSKEAWAASEPEVRKAWGLGPSPSDRQDQDWEASMYSIKEFDPKNINNIANLGMNALSYFGEQTGIADRRAQKDMADENAYLRTAGAQEPLISYTDPGTYDINAQKVLYPGMKPGAPYSEGFEGVMGKGIQSKYGGNVMAKGGTPYPQRFGSLAIYPTAMGGNDIDQYTGKKDVEVRDSLGPQDRATANLEAEGGETAYGDINGDGFPEHYKITGPRHTEGGVPLNLPDGTFIFSDTRSMKITDCNILKMFNKPCGKGGFTPATLAKAYDINKYRKILQDPESDVLDKKTAELMIKQSVLKLGALALAQESKKGFPQGIPEVARPYMEAMGIKDEDLLPKEQVQQQGTPEEMQMMQSVEEEGMPPVDQMAMQQEDMSGMPMEGMMSYGGTSKRTLKKAAQELSKEPCPEGMVWDPVYGCVPQLDQHMQNYTPEQINEYFNKVRKNDTPLINLYDNIIRDNPDYFTQPADEFILQQYKDNHIPVIQFDNGTYGVDYMNLDEDQRQQKGIVDRNYLGESMKALNKAGYPPDEWMEQMLNQNNPNKLQNDKNLEKEIEFYKNLYEYQEQYEQNMQDCPCRKKVIAPSGTMSQICVPCEQMPMAAYGMEMGGYDMPFAQNTFARGGQLDRYQSKGEVKTSPKSYRKEDLPADAVIKSEKDAWNLKEGDFILQSDGTYRKVTNVKFDPRKVAVDTQTQKQSVIDFMAKSPENVQIIKRANAIIEKGIDDKTILCLDKTCSQVRITGQFNPGFQDRIILSRALNSNADFGTNKYKVVKQSATEGYSRTEKGAYKGTGSFVAGFTPEDYEKRFIFEKARGAGNNDDEAFAIVDQVYNDPTLKAKFRRDYLNMLGVSNVPSSDDDLLKPDFYKTRYADVTRGIEGVLSKEGARPVIGDEQLSGFEHFDAFGFSPAINYETNPLTAEEKQKKDPLDPYAEQEVLNVPVPDYAPWWLQDTLKTSGAFGRMFSREDQYPTPVFANYGEQYGPMLNPDREIAASKEDASKILGQLASFAGPQSYIGAATGVAGQSARTAGDILSKYNDANVQLARQDIYSNNQIQNIAREKRREIVDKNKRETDLMKAKKQNTRLADMKYLEDSLISAITNRMKTSAVNSLYTEYNVDPSTGGYVYRTDTTRTPNPTKDTELKTIAQGYRDAQWDDDAAAKLALAEYNAKYAKGADNTGYPAEAILNLYNRREGGAIPKAQSGLTKYAPSALRSFLGLSDDLVQGAQQVLPLGSNIPVSLEDLQGITDINDYVNLIDPTVPENIPLQAGYSLDALKKLYEQYSTLTGKGIDYLSKIPGMSTLGTLTNAAMPVKFNLHSPILTGDKLTSMGSIKPDVVTDEVIYLLAKKREAGLPLDANEEMVLFTFKDKAINLLKNPPKVNKEDLNKVTPGAKPAETTAVIDPITQEARDTAAIEYFQRTYDSLMPFEKLFIDGQIGIGATAEAEKAAAKALKKPRATRKTKAKEEAAPESKVTAESPDLDKLRDQVAMEAYGEPYSELPTLAKKIVDNRVSMKINGEPEAPFKDGGAYIMGSTVFPFMFY